MKDQKFWEAIDALVDSSEILIDRPKGSKRPKYDLIYDVDYGYLKDTTAPDGDGIDVWRGSKKTSRADTIICTVDLLNRDSEIKLLLGCTEEEKEYIYHFHNQTEFMRGMMIKRDCKN